jgi:hypothetical protein
LDIGQDRGPVRAQSWFSRFNEGIALNLAIRVTIVIVFLSLGIAGQAALERHLAAAGPLPVMPLAKPLAGFPTALGSWRGEDDPVTDARQLYADDHLQRTYWNGNQVLSVWIAYSRDGKDRGHHPEVCMSVAGKAEDPSVRQTLELPGHAEPVQQYKFGAAGESVWVFYWYYTLPAPLDDRFDPVQRSYQRLHARPASITLEVFAPERSVNDAAGAREFVRMLDAAVQDFVGPHAIRGSKRLPVALVESE